MIHQQGLSIFIFLMITLKGSTLDIVQAKEDEFCDKLAYETVKLEIDLSDNEYKS